MTAWLLLTCDPGGPGGPTGPWKNKTNENTLPASRKSRTSYLPKYSYNRNTSVIPLYNLPLDLLCHLIHSFHFHHSYRYKTDCRTWWTKIITNNPIMNCYHVALLVLGSKPWQGKGKSNFRAEPGNSAALRCIKLSG